MTTVCFDGKVLAADSRSTTHVDRVGLHCPNCKVPITDLQREDAKKIHTGFNTSFRGSPILAVAGSGRNGAIDGAVEMLRNGVSLVDVLENAPLLLSSGDSIPPFALIIVTETDAWKLIHKVNQAKISRYREGELWSIGSCDSKVMALASLVYTKVTAVGAVGFASMVDQNTGGAIYYGDRDALRQGKLSKQEVIDTPNLLQMWSEHLRFPVPQPPAPEASPKKPRKRRGDQ